MMTVSIQTLLLSLHALAKERRAVGAKLDSGEFADEDLDELNDDIDRLTQAIGELGVLYEPQREGQEQIYPSVEKLLASYD